MSAEMELAMLIPEYNKAEVRRLYSTYLHEVIEPTTSIERQKEILRGFPHKRLDAMIKVLIGITVSGDKIRKVHTMNDYFNAEIRTEDLCKNLY